MQPVVPDPDAGEPWRRVGARMWLHTTDTPAPAIDKVERDELGRPELPPCALTIDLPSANVTLTAYGHTVQDVFLVARQVLSPIWRDAVQGCEPSLTEQAAAHWMRGYTPKVMAFPTWLVRESGYQWPERPLQTFPEGGEVQ